MLETSRDNDGPEEALAINAENADSGKASREPAPAGSYCLDYTEIMGRGLGGYGEWGALFCIILSQYGSAIA